MKLQDKYEVFGKWSCLAQCYIYAALHNKATDEERIPSFMEAMVDSCLLQAFSDKTLLDDECTVLNASKLMHAIDSEHKFTVTKKIISSAKDLPLKGYAAVRFTNGKNGHWVLFLDQVQLYNSLENSQCVKYGNITDARIISIEE